jgi:hypothetical protein
VHSLAASTARVEKFAEAKNARAPMRKASVRNFRKILERIRRFMVFLLDDLIAAGQSERIYFISRRMSIILARNFYDNPT